MVISELIKELKLNYDFPVYIFLTISATILAAIIGQLLGQILSHYLSNRRNKRKDFMEIYQGLYSKVISSISNYMAIKTNPRKYHDVHHNVVEGDLLDVAITRLEENIKYASPVLINIYERYYGYGFFEDGHGSNELSEKHILVYFLLDDILKFSKSTGIFNRHDRTRLKKLKHLYGIAAMSLDLFDMDKTETILTSHNFYGTNKSKAKIGRKYNKTLISQDNIEMAKHLLFFLNCLKAEGKQNLQDDIIEPLNRLTKK